MSDEPRKTFVSTKPREDPRAIAFYGKCGFVDVGWQTFVVGTNPQPPACNGDDDKTSHHCVILCL